MPRGTSAASTNVPKLRQGNGPPSSAARRRAQCVGVLHHVGVRVEQEAGFDDRVPLGVLRRRVVAGHGRVEDGTDRAEVDTFGQRRGDELPHELRVRGEIADGRAVQVRDTVHPALDLVEQRVADRVRGTRPTSVAAGAPCSGDENVTTVPRGGNEGSSDR